MSPDEIRDWLDGRIPATSTFLLRHGQRAGRGVVADGAKFPDGHVMTRSRPPSDPGDGPQQTSVWCTFGDVVEAARRDGLRIEIVPYGVLADMVRGALAAAEYAMDVKDIEVTRRHIGELVVQGIAEVLIDHFGEQAELEAAR